MPGPCDGLRVLDLSSGPVGGVATMVLADFGADVLKVERPGGDPWRRLAAAPMWLRGKRSVVLDLAAVEDRARLQEFAAGADVVVTTFRPGSAERLGADAPTLRALNPRLVYCSITGWGPEGPYAGYPASEGVVAAKSGRMRAIVNFPPREAPYFTPLAVASHAASQSAVTGILAALLARDRTGAGQLVETSLLQGMFPYDLNGLVRNQLARRYPEEFPPPKGGVPPLTLQYLPAQTSDGRWVQFANLMEHHFHSMIEAIGLSEIYADPRFASAPYGDSEDVLALRQTILARMRERPLVEWMEVFKANPNVAVEPFLTTQQALTHPDLVANNEVVEVVGPSGERARQVGLLARLDGTPGAVGGPAPAVGEHSRDLLDGRAWLGAPPEGAAAPAERVRHPLEGVTVLEFATVIAAPLGAALLADLGARVIKVEPIGGDPFRSMSPGLAGQVGSAKTTAGKESICVDLRRPEGQEIVRRLVAKADVLIHNYRPGVPERLGIGYEQLADVRPQLVHISVNGYGPDGPGAHRPAAHPIPGAVLGGALYQAGPAGAPSTLGTDEELAAASSWLRAANELSPDPNTSVVVANAALLALHARRTSGRGQKVVLSMLGANAYANFDDFLSYDGKRARPLPDAELLGFGPLYRLYRARSGWVFLGVTTAVEWRRLCAALGREELAAAQPPLADGDARLENDLELAAVLTAHFAQRDAAEWERCLIPLGVPCVRADEHTPGSFFLEDDHMRVNGFAPEVNHSTLGAHQRWGPTVTFSDTPGRYGPGALAGEHTDAILAELGYSDDELARVRVAVSSGDSALQPTGGGRSGGSRG